MKRPLLLTFSLGIALQGVAYGSEIDSFTRRYEPLEDSSAVINNKANEMLSEAVSRANEGAESCDDKKLWEEIRKDYNIIINNGKLINYIVQSPEVPKHALERKDSIYRDHTIFDGYLLARPAADMDGIGMGTTMNFNGHYIGSDKFEHIMGQGYHYYNRYYNKGYSLKRVLLIGNANERLHLGGNRIATGLYTFADLVANFQGMRFYNHILQRNEDLIGENLGPYVTCENNKWIHSKKIDFRNYIDAGFDEGYNCPAVVTSHALKGINKALDELRAKYPENNYTCPLDPKKLEEVKKKYAVKVPGWLDRTVTDYVFNPWNTLRKYKIGWMAK